MIWLIKSTVARGWTHTASSYPLSLSSASRMWTRSYMGKNLSMHFVCKYINYERPPSAVSSCLIKVNVRRGASVSWRKYGVESGSLLCNRCIMHHDHDFLLCDCVCKCIASWLKSYYCIDVFLFRWRIARQLAGWSALDEPDSDENSGMYQGDDADDESI